MTTDRLSLADDDAIDTDATPTQPAALDIRRPDTPTTLSDLAALRGEAGEVIAARVLVVETLRKASIRATHPEDWLLFKAPADAGGQIVGFLQDVGCARVRDLWGIEIYDVGDPIRIDGDAGSFHYLVKGSARCKLTRQTIEGREGGRSSADDFVKGKSGVELELLVRKAARANLDGILTRDLAGMESVPVDELKAAWAGTTKRIEACRLGRGFGSRDERVGGHAATAPTVDPPKCTHCGAVGVYRPARRDRQAFYGCPNYSKHPDKKFIVDAAKWVAAQTPLPTPDREPGAEG